MGEFHDMVSENRKEEKRIIAKKKLDMNILHNRPGHQYYEYTKKIVSLYGLTWTREFEICEGRAMSKSH